MAAPIVYHDVAGGADLNGKLFGGAKFWVAQRVPMRVHYLDLIKANGGQIVGLEKKADYLIADHLKRDAPAGSISYTFIDASIQKGELVDPVAHLAGPEKGTARDVGSRSRSTKGIRRPYTAEEDRILYQWVRDCERDTGTAGGNLIYQKLEEKYPQHPWQSWRDRYLKQLKDRPASYFGIPNNAPPTPPDEQVADQLPPSRLVPNKEKEPSAAGPTEVNAATQEALTKPSSSARAKGRAQYTHKELTDMFTVEDWENIYANVPVITENEDNDAVWGEWAATTTKTALQWKQYFKIVVRPQWEQDDEWKREQVVSMFQERIAREEEEEQQAAVGEQARLSAEKQPEPEPELVNGEKDVQKEETKEVDQADQLPPEPSSAGFAPPQMKVSAEDSFVRLYLQERKGKAAGDAYAFFALERRDALWISKPTLSYTDRHKILLPQWKALPDEEKAPYLVMEAADKRRYEIENALSLHDVAQDTPKDIIEVFEKGLKRNRDTDGKNLEQEEEESSSPAKRPRHEISSPASEEDSVIAESLEDFAEQDTFIGSQQQPLSISSREASSAPNSQSENADQLPEQDQNMEGALEHEIHNQNVHIHESDVDRLTDTSPAPEEDERPQTPQLEELDITSSSNFPSNTPTPRAPRQKSNFDTQAILSSPSEAFPLGRLPRPEGMTQLPESQSHDEHIRTRELSIEASSPIPIADGGESPTHSLQEFRRSLNGIPPSEDSVQGDLFAPIPRPARSLSPTQSETSSTGSGDPDPPLGPEEFDDYFSELHEDGFDDIWITTALKHTRCRPDLATAVLNAWKAGKPLPNRRGVWSKEDDEELESGDVDVLANLEQKHSMDGWGGITERLRFLERYREK